MPLPITTFFMMFFILPLIGIIEHLFPGSIKSVFDLFDQIIQSGSLDFISNDILPVLDQITSSDSFRNLMDTLLSPYSALVSKLMEIGEILGFLSP